MSQLHILFIISAVVFILSKGSLVLFNLEVLFSFDFQDIDFFFNSTDLLLYEVFLNLCRSDCLSLDFVCAFGAEIQ